MNPLMTRPEAEQAPANAEGMADGSADGTGKLQQAGGLLKQGVALLYDDRFDALIKMFKTSGAAGFPNAMATAINTVLEKLEQAGPVPADMAAVVGMKLFFMLLEDLVKGNVLPSVDADGIQQAIGETIKLYAQSHPDVTDEDMQSFTAELQKRAA